MRTSDEIAAVIPEARTRGLLARALETEAAQDWSALYDACNPDSADWLLKAALKARELGHGAFEKLIAATIAVAPGHVEACVLMAQSYLARGLARQAHALLANLRKQQAAKRPDDARLDEFLLHASKAAGVAEDARAAAYRLAISAEASWEALVSAGEFFRSENDLDAQRTLFARMLTLRPRDPDANLLMAAWLHDEGYDKEAQEHARRAQDNAASREQGARASRLLFELRFPQDAAELRKLTETPLGEIGESALVVLKRLTRKHPTIAEGWLLRGIALRRSGQVEEALAALERCVKLAGDPNAHKELAALYGEANDPSRAAKHARKALELLGEHDRISWINLGAALCELRRFPEAEHALARAQGLDPQSAQVRRLEQSINERRKPLRGYYNARMVRI